MRREFQKELLGLLVTEVDAIDTMSLPFLNDRKSILGTLDKKLGYIGMNILVVQWSKH